MRELQVFVRTGLVAAVVMLVARLMSPAGPWTIPLSVTVLDILLAFGGPITTLVVRRALFKREERIEVSQSSDKNRVLCIGAGGAGVLAAKELHGSGSGVVVVGSMDDDHKKQRSVVQGIRVLGGTADIARLAQEQERDQTSLNSKPECLKVLDTHRDRHPSATEAGNKF